LISFSIMTGEPMKEPSGKYRLPNGEVTTMKNIQAMTGKCWKKIKQCFEFYDYQTAWEMLDVDLRYLNHGRKVYRFDSGAYTTAKLLGDFYGVSKTTVQRYYRKADKDYTKANQLLAGIGGK